MSRQKRRKISGAWVEKHNARYFFAFKQKALPIFPKSLVNILENLEKANGVCYSIYSIFINKNGRCENIVDKAHLIFILEYVLERV